MWYWHTMKHYLASKGKEILIQAATGMNLEDSKLNKVSQSQEDRYCTTLLTCSTFCYLVAKPAWFFCDPRHCSFPGSLVHEIFQVRILEWVAISFPRDAVSRAVIFIELESRMVVIREQGRRKWGISVQWLEFQFGKVKKFWRWMAVMAAK